MSKNYIIYREINKSAVLPLTILELNVSWISLVQKLEVCGSYKDKAALLFKILLELGKGTKDFKILKGSPLTKKNPWISRYGPARINGCAIGKYNLLKNGIVHNDKNTTAKFLNVRVLSLDSLYFLPSSNQISFLRFLSWFLALINLYPRNLKVINGAIKYIYIQESLALVGLLNTSSVTTGSSAERAVIFLCLFQKFLIVTVITLARTNSCLLYQNLNNLANLKKKVARL